MVFGFVSTFNTLTYDTAQEQLSFQSSTLAEAKLINRHY